MKLLHHNFFEYPTRISSPSVTSHIMENLSVICTTTPWRNGSASDSRSEGCVFESRRGHNYIFVTTKTLDIIQIVFSGVPASERKFPSKYLSGYYIRTKTKTSWLGFLRKANTHPIASKVNKMSNFVFRICSLLS